MLIRTRPPWALPERTATPEAVYLDRRRLLGGLGGTLAAMTVAMALPGAAMGKETAATPSAPANSTPLGYPAARDARFVLDRAVTEETVAAHHNIFDEWTGDYGRVWQVAKEFKTDPWRVHIGGVVEKQQTFSFDELVRRIGLEERLYRHRCVDAWAMAVPWTGFPLAKLVELARPLSKARYLRMVSVARPDEMPAWYDTRRVFPYYEGLTLAEATHDLAFLATGIYGHPLPPQHGAPLRLVVPWKYGLKSIKSIVAFQFTVERPGTFWNELSPANYSFFCNVDPTETLPHSQAEEEMIGTREKRQTLPFNGYGELVAKLYA